MMEQNGFFDCAAEETLGLVAAAAMTCRVARLPIAVECAASSMLRPRFARTCHGRWPSSRADAKHADPFPAGGEIRAVHRSRRVRAAILDRGRGRAGRKPLRLPDGRSADAGWTGNRSTPIRRRCATPGASRVAAEIVGALKGGLDAVVAHVRDRHQFGRPLGSFQAIQHRLAGAAAKIEAACWLTLKAAQNIAPRRCRDGPGLRAGGLDQDRLRSASVHGRDGPDARASAASLDLSRAAAALVARWCERESARSIDRSAGVSHEQACLNSRHCCWRGAGGC